MDYIFEFVAEFLVWLSEISGFSYKEINIIVYFMVIPLIYLYLIDRLIKKHYFKIGFLISIVCFFIFIKDFEKFSVKLFDGSVAFLNWFAIIGWNYIEASVIICVVFPLILLFSLLFLVYRDIFKKS